MFRKLHINLDNKTLVYVDVDVKFSAAKIKVKVGRMSSVTGKLSRVECAPAPARPTSATT